MVLSACPRFFCLGTAGVLGHGLCWSPRMVLGHGQWAWVPPLRETPGGAGGPVWCLGTDSGPGHWECAWARPVSWGTVFLGHERVRGDTLWLGTTCGMVFVLPWSCVVLCLQPNARLQAPPMAGARHERRLLVVACKPLFGGGYLVACHKLDLVVDLL